MQVDESGQWSRISCWTWQSFVGGSFAFKVKTSCYFSIQFIQRFSSLSSHFKISLSSQQDNNRMSKSLPILIDTANAITTNTLPIHESSASTSTTEPSHQLHHSTESTGNAIDTSTNSNHHEKEQNDKLAFTFTHRHQTTPPSIHHRQNEIHNDDDANVIDAHGDDDDGNDIISPALAQPQIQATRHASGGNAVTAAAAAVEAATLAKSTKTQSWKIKHILIETSLTALGVFFLLIALVICTIFSLKQTTQRMSTTMTTTRMTASNHYCDKSNLISNTSSECEMDFNSSTTSILSQSTVMHV